jgi:cell wall-associated NlpC family hydrolase
MTCVKKISITTLVVLFFSCNWKVPESREGMVDEIIAVDSFATDPALHVIKKDSVKKDESPHSNLEPANTIVLPPSTEIDVRNVSPVELVDFAETLIGTPYVYGSINPAVGFDCSGFITYVFNHFDIRVPRSSVDFTNVGKEIQKEEAKRGDIILFTGTNPLERHVGHMGLVVSNTDTLKFIHATSGKAMSVTITPFSSYYGSRFVKTIRIFPSNGM